jgi:hypothetical protein
MFRYSQFDLLAKSKKSKILKMIINIVIISIIFSILYLNINAKEDVKIISSNSRRIITTLYNYTETMSNFIVSDENNDELNEIKNIGLAIDYIKNLKQEEVKHKELKQEELKLTELKQQELKLEELKLEELEMKRNKAISLIKSYIPNYDSLINLVSSHIEVDGYSNNTNCLKEVIKINKEELFNNLIKIDYENNKVSFNYLDNTNDDYYKNTDNIIKSHLYIDYDKNNRYYNYSHYIYRNYKNNIIKNPIYQIIKDQLKIDTYTEPNLEDEYNNKSRYFSRSLNDFAERYNIYNNYDKYYETYENDTYYLYLKSINYDDNYYKTFNYIEFLIENKIIITNPNSNEIYNKNPYKFMCNIPSLNGNYKPSINIDYSYYISSFTNKYCCGNDPRDTCNSCRNTINTNDIANSINIYCPHYNPLCGYNNKNNYLRFAGSHGTTLINNVDTNYFKNAIELDINKGQRMIKHNLTNNIPLYINYDQYHDELIIQNYYFIEKVYIDFPLIEIYDEYDYIKKIISDIVDIYNLPIIPPIKII